MRQSESATKPSWSLALKYLRSKDPRLSPIIKEVGPCTLAPKPPGDYFMSLAHAICSQQLATAAANTIFQRYCELFPRRRPTPELTLTFSDDQLEAVGFSMAKRKYLKDLSFFFVDGRLPVRKFPHMSDEEIIASLTTIAGIGQWTAEMFLIFVLNRPDVFPVDDLGIQKGVAALNGFPDLVRGRKLIPHGEIWRPYRTIASWYLWKGAAMFTAATESKS